MSSTAGQTPTHSEGLTILSPKVSVQLFSAISGETNRMSAPLIRLVSPEMALNNCTLTLGDKMVNPSECVGVWPAVLDMNLHSLHYGRFFNDIDEAKPNSI